MRNISNREEYIKCLEDYMFISEGCRPPLTSAGWKLPHLAESIRDYQSRRGRLSPFLKVATMLVFIVLTSLMMGIAVIWCINEVARFYVPFSFRNIMIISCLFFIGKARLELFKKK